MTHNLSLDTALVPFDKILLQCETALPNIAGKKWVRTSRMAKTIDLAEF